MPIKENKITITEIPNLNRLDRFNEFLIQIKIEAMMPEIKLLKHDGLETDDSASSTLVYYVTPFKRYKILEITGASINIALLELAGIIISFKIYFNASATVCSKPNGPTTFGPFLFWTAPQILLSNHTIKATDIRTGTKTKNIL